MAVRWQRKWVALVKPEPWVSSPWRGWLVHDIHSRHVVQLDGVNGRSRCHDLHLCNQQNDGDGMPVMLFFFMGFEHSIVNMFLFPFSMIMGVTSPWLITSFGTKSPPH